MPKGDGYVVLFSTGVCLLCSLMLAATSSSLRERQQFNKEIDRKTNVLKAFGHPIRDAGGKRITAAEVDAVFKDKIAEIVIDGRTGQAVEGSARAADPLTLYVWRDNGEAVKYAFPISGKGLWSTIKGYLSLEKDLATIVGVTFYEHGETPGLGGECEADWFQNNFKGKKVWANGKRLPFQVVKGAVADRYPEGNDHAVDGMSGATLTGNGITQFINRDLDKYEKYFTLQRGS
jgi:Na+-transporting NADH:ubiquinone oxidoreductase subunit C